MLQICIIVFHRINQVKSIHKIIVIWTWTRPYFVEKSYFDVILNHILNSMFKNIMRDNFRNTFTTSVKKVFCSNVWDVQLAATRNEYLDKRILPIFLVHVVYGKTQSDLCNWNELLSSLVSFYCSSLGLFLSSGFLN